MKGGEYMEEKENNPEIEVKNIVKEDIQKAKKKGGFFGDPIIEI